MFSYDSSSKLYGFLFVVIVLFCVVHMTGAFMSQSSTDKAYKDSYEKRLQQDDVSGTEIKTGTVTGLSVGSRGKPGYWLSVKVEDDVFVYEVTGDVREIIGVGQEVSVEVLILKDGSRIAVQDRVLDSAALLGRSAEPSGVQGSEMGNSTPSSVSSLDSIAGSDVESERQS